MAINFNSINLEVIDLNTNLAPDIFINQNCITFSKRVLEDLGYPPTVQYCLDAEHKVFAIRVCKGNEVKAVTFSKPKAEQTVTLSNGSKNLREVIITMIPGYDSNNRYKVTGEYDAEKKIMYFDMAEAKVIPLRSNISKDE